MQLHNYLKQHYSSLVFKASGPHTFITSGFPANLEIRENLEKRLSFFPVKEKSGNLGKIPEIREKSGNFVWSDFPDLCRKVHTIKTGNRRYFIHGFFPSVPDRSKLWSWNFYFPSGKNHGILFIQKAGNPELNYIVTHK